MKYKYLINMTFSGLNTEEIHAIDKYRKGDSFTQQITPTSTNPLRFCLIQLIGERFPIEGM